MFFNINVLVYVVKAKGVNEQCQSVKRVKKEGVKLNKVNSLIVEETLSFFSSMFDLSSSL